jgi:hypothetical protein
MWFRLVRREAEFIRDAELGIVPDDDGQRSEEQPQETATA